MHRSIDTPPLHKAHPAKALHNSNFVKFKRLLQMTLTITLPTQHHQFAIAHVLTLAPWPDAHVPALNLSQ